MNRRGTVVQELPVTVIDPKTGPAAEQQSADKLLHVIVNPSSGNGRAAKRWPEFARAIKEHGFSTDVHFTTGPDDARRIARQMAEASVATIVAVGGDGTVNEIINGMICDDALVSPQTRLALVPSGTGKDLSRSLGTREVEYTLRALELKTVTHIDVGRIDFHADDGVEVSRYFVNVADLGLGADVASRINRSSKALGGLMSYMINSIKTIIVFNAQAVRVTVDDVLAYDGRAHLVIFANGRFFAGGMHIAPDSSLRDGLLDIFILEDVSKRELLTSLLPSVYRGKHIGKRGVHHLKGARATVETGASMLIEMDGEQPGHGPATIRTIPRVLPIVAAGAVLR